MCTIQKLHCAQTTSLPFLQFTIDILRLVKKRALANFTVITTVYLQQIYDTFSLELSL